MYPNIVFAFPLVKIVTRGPGRRYLVAGTCLRFSACKSHNAGAAAAGVPAAVSFLSNTSLAVFAFSIANAGAAAAGVSSGLHVSVFAFPLVKIVTWG